MTPDAAGGRAARTCSDLPGELRRFVARARHWPVAARRRYRKLAAQAWDGFARSASTLALGGRADPVVSVILVTYNQPDLTYACLASLEASTDLPFELIVVDNASGPDTRRLLERVAGAKILVNAENLGYLRACNQGAAGAAAPLLLLLNSDAVVLRDAIAAAARTLREDERIGVVGARLILPNGRLQEAGGRILADGQTRGIGRGRNPANPSFLLRRAVDYVSGAFLLTRRSLWRELGGFSDAFAPAYYEDVDYCARVRARGGLVVYEPAAAVLHYEYGSGSRRHAASLMRRNRETFSARSAMPGARITRT